MSLKEVSKPKVITISKKSTLKDAARLMQDKHVGSLVVVDALDGKLIPIGMITDRDMALCLSSTRTPQDLIIEEVMQSKPLLAKVSDGIYETVVRMRESGVRRLPVVQADGTLAGVICADDLLTLLSDEIKSLAQIPEKQIRKEQGEILPTHPQPRV
jgi:signal-transduction protein with cAMP-binding, CBS, and nucleotidyltransferase domain